MSKEKLIFYFGYGSNMSLKYLQGRRGVYPVESYPGVLKGFSLIMNMEGPIFVEPSFANIIKDEQGTVEGVLHLITKNELQKIKGVDLIKLRYSAHWCHFGFSS